MSIRKAILAFTALSALTSMVSTAMAEDPIGILPGNPPGNLGDRNIIWNPTQTVWGDKGIHSKVQLLGTWVGGDVRGGSTTIANNLIAATSGGTYLFNLQYNLSKISAETYVTLDGVDGNVDLQTTAVCNNASLDVTQQDTGGALVDNDQRCWKVFDENPINVNAFTAVSLGTIGGDLKVASTAIGNNLSIATDGGSVAMGVRHVIIEDHPFHQVSTVPIYAQVDAQIGTAGGDFEINATAVGNNISINAVGLP